MLRIYRTVPCYDFGSLLGWSHAMVGTSDRGCHKGPCKERKKEHSVGPYCIYLWPYRDSSWAGHRVCWGSSTWGVSSEVHVTHERFSKNISNPLACEQAQLCELGKNVWRRSSKCEKNGWSSHVGNLLQSIRCTIQIWVLTRHQCGISALVSQTPFYRETRSGIAKCWLFLKLGQWQNGKLSSGVTFSPFAFFCVLICRCFVFVVVQFYAWFIFFSNSLSYITIPQNRRK